MKLMRELTDDEIKDISKSDDVYVEYCGLFEIDPILFARACFKAAWINQQDDTK